MSTVPIVVRAILMILASTSLWAARTATAFTAASSRPATRAFSRTLASAANPKVFFDMEVGGESVGRIEFELRADIVPKVRGDV